MAFSGFFFLWNKPLAKIRIPILLFFTTRMFVVLLIYLGGTKAAMDYLLLLNALFYSVISIKFPSGSEITLS